MKKVILLIFIGVFIFGCSAERKSETANVSTVSANSADANKQSEATANRSANQTSQMPPTGDRVEQTFEINFKDGLPKGFEAIDPEKENPSEFKFENGALKLKIPAGKDLYGENRTAPRLLKTVSGDFEIETRLKFSPISSYQGAGLLIFSNSNNYLRLERGFGGVGGGDSGIRFDKREDEAYEPVATPGNFPTEEREVELKIRRKGKDFTAFWREAGKTEWAEVGKVTNNYPDKLEIGLIGVNTAEEVTAEFLYLKISPIAK